MLSSSVGLVVLAVTLLVFVVVGVRAHRRGADVEDYVAARNSQDALTLGLSFVGAATGAWILFAPPEVGAVAGPVGVLGYAAGAAAPVLLFALLGPRLRAVVPAGHSLPEFLRVRFGPAVAAWMALVSVGYMLLFVTAELTAAAAVTSALAGIDPAVTVLAVTAATLLYTTVGGLRSSLRTDRFQAWLILGLLAAGCWALATGLPDPSRAWATGAAGSTGGLEVALTLILAVTAANLFHQGYWQRVWAAHDTATLRRGAVLGALAAAPVVALVGAMGVLAAGSGVDLGSPPAPFFALLTGLPAWVAVVVLVLAVALVSSSVDTLQTALASLVTSQRRDPSLTRARWTTVLFMVPAVVVALQGFGVLRLFLIADLLCAGIAVPALLGLWARATPAGALAGSVAGLVGGLLGGAVPSGSLAGGLLAATFPSGAPTLAPFLGALVVSAVVTVAVSLLGRRTEDLEAIGARVAPIS